MLTLLTTVMLLQGSTGPAPVSFVEDVRKLAEAQDNDQRFEVLTTLLRERNVSFEVEPFTIDKAVGREPRTRGRNIVVSLGRGRDELIIGAHYDAVRLQDGSLSRGAVDNGASSIMLVHLAGSLRGERLRMRVRLVWFDMEETGHIGSLRYVEAHRSDRIRAMLNFDINASGDTVLFSPPPGGEDARVVQTFVETCARVIVDCVRFARFPEGDDRSFGKAGIPTLSIGILPAVEVHQLWLMLNGGPASGLREGFAPAILRTIHTPEDTPDKVDGATIGRVHRLALELVRQLGLSQR